MNIAQAKQHLAKRGCNFLECRMSRESWERVYVFTSPEHPGKEAGLLSCEMRAIASIKNLHWLPAGICLN